MTNPRTIAKRNERAKAKAGLIFVAGKWLRPEDAARIQRAMDEAAERVREEGEK